MTKSQLSYLTVKQNSNFIYSRTPRRYGRLSNTDSFQCPYKIIIYFLLKKTSIIRTLSDTDNGHYISAPESKFV